MSEYEANERLDNFSLNLIGEPNFVENRRDLTHIDYYENIELLLTDTEYANLQGQIKKSQGFTNLNNYYKGLTEFKAKPWTFGEVFGQSHLSSKEVIIEPDLIELAYYHKFHSGIWVEKINVYTKQPEYYKQVSGTDGGIISIFQNGKKLFYTNKMIRTIPNTTFTVATPPHEQARYAKVQIVTKEKDSTCQADFVATLNYRTTEEGGRKTPAKSGYRPMIKVDFDEMQTSGQQTFLDRGLVFPGDVVDAEIKIVEVEYFTGLLAEGIEFELREGPIVVGQRSNKAATEQKLKNASR